jgi:hypothetical protein
MATLDGELFLVHHTLMVTARRSRFIATPKGAPYRVTAHDLDVLQLLQTYRYLPSNYIAALLAEKSRWYKYQLAKLRHEAGLIECPNASWAAANARYRPAVYALTAKGMDLLKERGLYAPRRKTGREFNHELMVCLIQASFELSTREHGLEVIRAQDILDHPNCPAFTRLQKDPWSIPVAFTFNGHKLEEQVETDGDFFGLARSTNTGRTALLFPGFEADRRTEPLEPEDYERSSIKKKFIKIREVSKQHLYRSRYGLPNAIVPVITINEAHKRSLMRVLENITEGHGSKLFIFKSMPNFASFENFPPPTGHMVTKPWDRVGHPPYSILDQFGKEVV